MNATNTSPQRHTSPPPRIDAFVQEMGLRGTVLRAAFERFAQYGIKSISMDDVANAVGISKRTLYELFKDKEALLAEGIEIRNLRLRSLMAYAEQEGETALDVVLCFVSAASEWHQPFSPKFFIDIQKYPVVVHTLEKDRLNFIHYAELLLSRGIRESVFLAQLNPQLIAYIATSVLDSLHPLRAGQHFPGQDVGGTVLYTFLRGICTATGQTIIDRYFNPETMTIKTPDNA